MGVWVDRRVGGVPPRHYLGDPGKRLVNVPDEVRKCVVFLAYDSPAQGEVLAGTAFYLAVEEAGRRFAYLVTAAHVIRGMQGKGVTSIIVRVNTKAGATARYSTDPADWVCHPAGPTTDVAAYWWPVIPEQDFKGYPAASAATPEVISREGIGLGDETFMVGLYTKHAGTGRNVPIVRVGNLAALREEPKAGKDGPMDAYLVEIRSIGGISGSPVFVRTPPAVQWAGKEEDPLMVGSGFFLLGLMHGRWDMRHLAPIEYEIDSHYLDQPLNSGIGVVVPVERITELLDLPVFAAKRAEALEQLRRRDAAATD